MDGYWLFASIPSFFPKKTTAKSKETKLFGLTTGQLYEMDGILQSCLYVTFQLTLLWNSWVLDPEQGIQQLGVGQMLQLADLACAITVSFAVTAEDQPISTWGLPHAGEISKEVIKLQQASS